jgi:hypothetical protein
MADADPQKLTYAQRAGAEPLPSPLAPTELSPKLRALLWASLHGTLPSTSSSSVLSPQWLEMLRWRHVSVKHEQVHTFVPGLGTVIQELSGIFARGDHVAVFGFLEFALRYPKCPLILPGLIKASLHESLSGMQLIDDDTFVPLPTEHHAKAFTGALGDLQGAGLVGARVHLKKAGEDLGKGNFNDSVRESIHAVESVAKMIEPTADTLGPALKKLGAKKAIHSALEEAMKRIYGYTSNEQGIRHALLDEPEAKVDFHDALYMLGSCASFVTYLVGKCREAGLIKE